MSVRRVVVSSWLILHGFLEALYEPRGVLVRVVVLLHPAAGGGAQRLGELVVLPQAAQRDHPRGRKIHVCHQPGALLADRFGGRGDGDRKSTRLNSSHQIISYAVFSLKKKKNSQHTAH